MTDDIVTRLRELREVLIGNPIMAREVQEAMDEIERLRNMLAHGLVFGSTCEGCLICEELKEFHEQTLREIALENQTSG